MEVLIKVLPLILMMGEINTRTNGQTYNSFAPSTLDASDINTNIIPSDDSEEIPKTTNVIPIDDGQETTKTNNVNADDESPEITNTNTVNPNDDSLEVTNKAQDSPATEDEYQNTIHTQFVEFRPDIMTAPPVTVPPPRYILNATYAKEDYSTTTSTTTTEDPEEEIKVVPIKKNYQRGVLDLLFPSARVKSFKNIFDSIRRLLSHTFRR